MSSLGNHLEQHSLPFVKNFTVALAQQVLPAVVVTSVLSVPLSVLLREFVFPLAFMIVFFIGVLQGHHHMFRMSFCVPFRINGFDMLILSDNSHSLNLEHSQM